MRQPWVYDVVTEHAALTTTGGRVWDAARRLCSFLEEVGPELGLSRPGLRVLELGAGLGWLGMTLARNLPDAEVVVLTEQEEGGGLDWLRHNLALNTHLPGMGAVRAEPCDWRQYGELTQAHVQPTDRQRQHEREGGSSGVAARAGVADVQPTGGEPAVPPGREPPCSTAQDQQQPPQQLGVRTAASSPTPSDAHSHGSGPDPRPHPTGAEEEAAAGAAQLSPTSGDAANGFGSATTTATTTTTTTAKELQGVDGSGGGGDGGEGIDRDGGGGGWLRSQRWDFILGSDLVYNDIGTDCLPRVMRALAGPDTRILYCHTKHRFDTFDMQFYAQMAGCGLEVREVRQPSLTTPPPSPPPLTELFPDMRIAVYDIRLAG